MKRSNITVMRKLIVMVKPLLGFMIVAIIMGVLGNLFASFITILGVLAIGSELSYFTYPFKALIISMVVFALLRGALRYLEQASNHYIAFKILALIRDKVFRKLRVLAPSKLDGKDKGDLINVITSDIELLEVFYAHTISPIMIAIIYSLIMTIFLATIDLKLALIALFAYLVIGLWLPSYISKRNQDNSYRLRMKTGAFSAYVLDSLRGLKEIMSFNYGQKRLNLLKDKSEELSSLEKKAKEVSARNIAMTNMLIMSFDILMLAAGIMLYQNNTITFGGMILSLAIMMSSFGPVVALANLGSGLENTMAAGNRVLDILDEDPLIKEVKDKTDIVYEKAVLKDVSFAYDDEAILKDVSLELKDNEILGIVGKSGSGKSTLLKLLMRFYDRDEGQLSLNDHDIKDINTRSLRENESYLTQDTILFHDTILNNIKIAKLDATLDEVIEACKKANIHEFIENLPEGYNTMIKELGSSLSGGERQRIGLARAFLHDAALILLDEPTSNLDALNEAIILRSIKDAAKDKTFVLVSHRPSSINIASKTFKMDEGRVS